jgi:hypothetical protein
VRTLPDHDLGFNQRDLGHGAAETVLHPAVMVALLLAIALILWRPRKYAAIPVLLIAFLVPRGQEIYLAGQHWYVLRIVILVGSIRLARAKFQIAGGLNGVDKAFILWALYRVTAVVLTNGVGVAGEQVSFLIQAFGGYFLMRHLIQDDADIARAAKAMAIVTAILGACMLNEHFRNLNLFGYLGGGRLIPEWRNGQIRAQATFGHSILAGCFGATLLPLFFWLWKSGKANALAVAGMAGSTIMVLMSNSSTPVLAYTAGVGALFLWPIRASMRTVRRGIVLALVVLALVMNAPVWFIVAHVNVVGGSGGYDRAFLIDVFMRHIKDWWLIGTNQNGSWGYDMWDLSNQFVAEGEMGGLVTFVCFVAVISRSFSRLGKMRKQVERKEQWLLWSLGAVMLAHIFAYFGVAYWDQTQIWWFAFLAMISAATATLQDAPERAVKQGAESSGSPDTEAWQPNSVSCSPGLWPAERSN